MFSCSPPHSDLHDSNNKTTSNTQQLPYSNHIKQSTPLRPHVIRISRPSFFTHCFFFFFFTPTERQASIRNLNRLDPLPQDAYARQQQLAQAQGNSGNNSLNNSFRANNTMD